MLENGLREHLPHGATPDYPLIKAVNALALMRQALDLLDQAGARHAGCQLQLAIDTLCPPE